jgi:ATP-binding cassette subfamily C (CFTR/MRP) protein 1
MYRWIVQVRGNLVSLIYRKSMTLQYAGSGDKAAVSLMSTDIERVVVGLPNVHEIWATVLEVSVAVWLLERQVSYAVVAPVGLVAITTALISRIGPKAGGKAKIWAGLVQKRVAATNDYLGNLRAFRIAGLGATAAHGLQKLRIVEIAAQMVRTYSMSRSRLTPFAEIPKLGDNGHGNGIYCPGP